MTIVAIGNVYYADDPDKKPFRRVYQLDTDPVGVLDDPQWITANLDSTRLATLQKYLPTDVIPPLNGFPDAPATTNGLDIHGNPWPPPIPVTV